MTDDKATAVPLVEQLRSVPIDAKLRIDTPNEAEYYRHGGILQYVLRRLIG